MVADYNYQQGAVITSDSTLVTSGTGVLKDVAGGTAQQVYDMLGNPIASIPVNALGVFPSFRADIPRGVLGFGLVDLPVSSLEAADGADALVAAAAAAVTAESARLTAAESLQELQDYIDTHPGGDVADVFASPAFGPALEAAVFASPAISDLTPEGSALPARLGWRDDTNTLRWTAATEVVARALGWSIADDYALDTTGTTTHTAGQVQAWLDAASAGGKMAYAAGTIKCSGTITVKADVDLHLLTLNYTGTGTAIVVGDGSVLFRKQIHLPTVICAAKTENGWAQAPASVGVKVVNANACIVRGSRIANFASGLVVRGEGQGNVYNYIDVAQLDNNKVQLDISADATGWSNENTYRIARFSYPSAEGASVTGARDIRIQSAASIPNNNLFLGGSVEGDTPEYHLECAGGENLFLGMRWENGAAGCRVWWRTGAFRNLIDRGYDSHKIVETPEAGSGGHDVHTGQGCKYRQSAGASGVLQVENSSSSANPAFVIMPAGAAVAGTSPVTGYSASISANLWALKRSAESFDRIQLDPVNSRIYLGVGSAAPAMYIASVSTSGISVNGGHLYSGTDNTYDIGLAASLRFRDLNLGRNAVVGGTLKVTGNVGFYNTAPAAKPTVTGSRGGNAAVASLLTALATLGLVTDNTSA